MRDARVSRSRSAVRSGLVGCVSLSKFARATLAASLLLSWFTPGCEPADQTPRGRGSRIFQRTCASCHGADARGVRRRGLAKKPRDLTDPVFQAEASDERLRTSIRLGKGQMPAFGALMPPRDLDHLIAFIRSLNPERPPAEPPKPAEPASGLAPTAAASAPVVAGPAHPTAERSAATGAGRP